MFLARQSIEPEMSFPPSKGSRRESRVPTEKEKYFRAKHDGMPPSIVIASALIAARLPSHSQIKCD